MSLSAIARGSAALDGWVAAFEREMEQTGYFATSVGAMTAHGCFDVQAVVERWILANPTRTMTLAQVQPALRETPLRSSSTSSCSTKIRRSKRSVLGRTGPGEPDAWTGMQRS